MARKRKTDPLGSRTRYGTERVIGDGKKWYFCTRERTIEGPFEDKFKALAGLEMYLQVLNPNLLAAESTLAQKNA